VVGIVITHGHEDHIGAIHHVLNEIPAPVYATPLTIGLIEAKLARNNALGKAAQYGASRPERPAWGVPGRILPYLSLHPGCGRPGDHHPAGLFIHMSDFKFDHTPVDGWPTDYAKLAELSNRGVDLLLSDSTNSERPGWTPSEMVIGPALDNVFASAPGRIIVASFASLISRMQQVSDAAVRHNRKLAFVGTSMVDNAKIARNWDTSMCPMTPWFLSSRRSPWTRKRWS
jgi:ribonuclease J